MGQGEQKVTEAGLDLGLHHGSVTLRLLTLRLIAPLLYSRNFVSKIKVALLEKTVPVQRNRGKQMPRRWHQGSSPEPGLGVDGGLRSWARGRALCGVRCASAAARAPGTWGPGRASGWSGRRGSRGLSPARAKPVGWEEMPVPSPTG